MTAATLRRMAGAMLRPKGQWLGTRDRRLWEWPSLSFFTDKLGPPERRTLREIAEGGDLLIIDDRTYIVAELSPKALDAIAAFEMQGEELEDGDDDGCNAHDDDPGRSESGWDPDDSDREADDEGEPGQDLEHELQGFCSPMAGPSHLYPTLEQQLQRWQDDKNGVTVALVAQFRT